MDWYKTSVPEEELQHHGILGQKWGVRRFQNEDGTWTEEGKKRYGKDSSGKTASKLKDEGLHDPSSVRSSPSEVKQKQLAKRESTSGKWKAGSISSRLDENARQTAINQGDFSAWAGGTYQEIREDLSQEELLKILMNALDNDILSDDSDDPSNWVYQLDENLKFYIPDYQKTARTVLGEPKNIERQVWNEMIDELQSDPKFKEKLNDLRAETVFRKIEKYIELDNNTPHDRHPNGAENAGKSHLYLTDKDIEAMRLVPLSRWAEAPAGTRERYRTMLDKYNLQEEAKRKTKESVSGLGHSDNSGGWYFTRA